MTRVRWLHYHQSEYLRTKGSVLQFFNWRTAGGPEKDLRTSTGSVLHFFAYSTPSPIKSGPATSSIRGPLENRWRTAGGPQDQHRISPPLFLPTTLPPRSSPVLQHHQLEDLSRTTGGPKDQHRIGPPLFLPTTPPPWSSPVLQHHQLEDRCRVAGGPQDQHRISPPLFLLTTAPTWSSPVLQHQQLEDRSSGGPQEDLRTSTGSVLHYFCWQHPLPDPVLSCNIIN